MRRTFEIAVGVILLLFGIVILGSGAWTLATLARASIRAGTLPADGTSTRAIVFACFFAIALLATQIGFRLVLERPDAHGSLLSPSGWATLALVFLGVGTALTIMVVQAGGPTPIGLDLGLALFAAVCGMVALRVRSRSRALR